MSAPLPTTVDSVIDRLRANQRSLPARDGVAVFNGLYLDVTERVVAAIGADDFADAGFMTERDVGFANLWLSAYDAAAAGRHERRHRARPVARRRRDVPRAAHKP